jgi:ribose/xylose/arabinose/galactoside ABC-type transport system permease subunit
MATNTALFRAGVIRDRLTQRLSQEYVLLISVLLLTLVTTATNTRFMERRNITTILGDSSYVAVAAIGMSLVIISGNIDVSVGAMIGMLATISGRLAIADGVPIIVAYTAPLICGALLGALTGFMVAYLRIPAIVVTLGMMSILQGVLILWTGGEWIYDLPDTYKLAQWRLLGIPVPVYFMVLMTILIALWMRYSDMGRWIYAVGGNAEAARLAGISRERTLMLVFTFNGVMLGIAAVLFATQRTSIQSTVPSGLLLTIISASVIGGVSILGGIGTVIGSTLGAILLRTINASMLFADISQYWLGTVQGILILFTVLLDLLRRRRQKYLS